MEMSILPCEIRCAYGDEWQDAMALAWRTFLKFEAGDYPMEGVRNFNNFITDSGLYYMFSIGEYQLYLALDQKKIVGLISLRNVSHISLLFVEEAYHKKGIATALVTYLVELLKKNDGISRITVNSSPYAVGFYHRVGFTDLGPETKKDGIIYTPMELLF